MSESSDDTPAQAGDSAPDESEDASGADESEDASGADESETATGAEPATDATAGGSDDVETLRREVEEKYDFENFGPRDMAEMEPEEWEAAFDADTWITGEELLDRVEADLRSRVADRDVFARIERFDDVLVAYDDQGYAAVYPDGSVEGRGTVLRDVKPTVALCSMDSYDVPDVEDVDEHLPSPDEVPESSDALGNTVLQVIAAVQVLAGLVLLGAAVLSTVGVFRPPGISAGGTNLVIVILAGLGFLLVGVFLFVTVANARLSDRFRAAEYRDRLRAVGLEDGERPAFLSEIDGLDLEPPTARPGIGEGPTPSAAADDGVGPEDPGSGGVEPTSQPGEVDSSSASERE